MPYFCVSVKESRTYQSESLASVPSRRETPAAASLQQDVSELSDWLIMLQHMRKKNKVKVGDIREIEEAIVKQKVGNFYGCSRIYLGPGMCGGGGGHNRIIIWYSGMVVFRVKGLAPVVVNTCIE